MVVVTRGVYLFGVLDTGVVVELVLYVLVCGNTAVQGGSCGLKVLIYR